jgi:hypothetical protein
MTTADKREKLHNLIDNADDEQLMAMYKKIEVYLLEKSNDTESSTKMDKMEVMKQAANDPLFLADMKEVMDDFGAI